MDGVTSKDGTDLTYRPSMIITTTPFNVLGCLRTARYGVSFFGWYMDSCVRRVEKV